METSLKADYAIDFALFQLFHRYSRSPIYQTDGKSVGSLREGTASEKKRLQSLSPCRSCCKINLKSLVISRRSCAGTAKSFARKKQLFNKTKQNFSVVLFLKSIAFWIFQLRSPSHFREVPNIPLKGAVSRQSSSFCLITRPQSQWNLK